MAKTTRTKKITRNALPLPPAGVGFSIVGVGASAGGLEAFTQLLSHLPPDCSMAFVLLQHLDPKHESQSADILSRVTQLPVTEAKHGMRVEPGHVYVIPSNFNLEIFHGILKLSPRDQARGQHFVIDLFLKSLSIDQSNRALGVVLSGTGTDGTQGLAAIKAAGGITFAQDPHSAKFDQMPRSAIASGSVDLILTPEEISKEILRITSHPYLAPSSPASQATESEERPLVAQDSLNRIFLLLRNQCHLDFTLYKANTFRRRLERRMLLNKFSDLSKYAEFLSQNPKEVEALYADALIHVTAFFRDPEAYEALKTKVFPKLMENRVSGSPLRLWVTGCSTGEEVYSLAISLIEFLDNKASHTPIQIFATDISEEAIHKARVGEYAGIAEDVSLERLNRYFVRREDGKYKIAKSIRDICLFSRHDVTTDPPFAKIDLVSCRNLLIYFTPALQKHVIPVFHYSIRSHGFLWLGKSESIGGFSDLFSLIDKPNKIYARCGAHSRMTLRFPLSTYVQGKPQSEVVQEPSISTPLTLDLKKIAEQALQVEYPGVLVNENMDVVQAHGQTMPFIGLPQGPPSHSLLKMVHPDLLRDLRTTVQAAKGSHRSAKKEDLLISDGRTRYTFSLKVVPVNAPPPSKTQFYLILFENIVEVKPEKKKKARPGSRKTLKAEGKKDLDILELQRELETTQEHQHALTLKFESAQEDLTTANEELQSTNEELQSSNEELETAKEELQSGNEELSTVNDELQTRSLEQIGTNNDLINLLGSVEIPIVMLSDDRRIRRFTPLAGKALNLINADIGRPLSDLKLTFKTPGMELDLEQMVSQTIETLVSQEVEVQDRQERWFRLQVRPYKTIDHRIDGAVLAFVDINSLKLSLKDAKEERVLRERFVEALSHDLRSPLTAAKLAGELLSRMAGTSEKLKRLADRIVVNMDRADRMIRDLLDANRLKAGEGVPIAVAPGRLDLILETVIREMNELHPGRFELRNEAGILSGYWDCTGLHRVFDNLATNAIKYGKANSPVLLTLTSEHNWVEVAVHNEGIAISPEDQETLFNAYIRTNSARKGGELGWGIGLTLVRGITEAHGGTARVQSEPGHGTTFFIRLPLDARTAL